jgi:hypothetical protein
VTHGPNLQRTHSFGDIAGKYVAGNGSSPVSGNCLLQANRFRDFDRSVLFVLTRAYSCVMSAGTLHNAAFYF